MKKLKTEASGIEVHCSHTKLLELVDLVPNPRNPNKHPEAQITILAKVIQSQGWRSPIVVSSRSGFIVKGHGRYEAAKRLGVDMVPVDVQEYETEAAEWADLIADNRIAELAETDSEMLRGILSEVRDACTIDLELTGFSEFEIETILTTPEFKSQEPPDDFPEAGDDIKTDYRCPKCSYEWSGKAK